MSLSFGILGFLNYGPMSGYDLVKAFQSSVEFFWYAQNSHIYLELKKLEKNGYICGETVVQSARPNKKIFYITDAGRKAFLDWLAKGEENDVTHMKSVFLMKIFFGGNLPPSQGIERLKKFRADCEAYLKKMDSIPASIQNYGADKEPYQTIYWQMAAEFGDCYIRTCIAWAGRCIEKLETMYTKGVK